jgi:hypothetical protein
MTEQLILGDCLSEIPKIKDMVHLNFGSPPYEDARLTCGRLKGQAWVDWMLDVVRMCMQTCSGMTAFVIQGRTRKFAWSGTPALLIADLIRGGFTVREPLFYHRNGIPGSGGPDDFRHDIEYIIRVTNGGKLPWSDNLAMGHPPKYGPGGAISHRKADGSRVGDDRASTGQPRASALNPGIKLHTKRRSDGSMRTQVYKPPKIANPGNVIECGSVGGGNMGTLPGHELAHENHAPFPEYVAEWMIRSYCPPGGTVVDPFCGSGTTLAVAKALGRNYIGIDIDREMIKLSQKRLDMIRPGMLL